MTSPGVHQQETEGERAAPGQIWKPRWYFWPFAPDRIEVQAIVPSEITGEPYKAECVADDGMKVSVTLDKRGRLDGFKLVSP